MKPLLACKDMLTDAPLDLYLCPGNSGNCRYDESGIRMEVGADQAWPDVVSTLLHEAEETVLAGMCLRMSISDRFHVRPDEYRFFITHEDYTSVCDHAGRFMARVLPALATTYRTWTKKRKAQ